MTGPTPIAFIYDRALGADAGRPHPREEARVRLSTPPAGSPDQAVTMPRHRCDPAAAGGAARAPPRRQNQMRAEGGTSRDRQHRRRRDQMTTRAFFDADRPAVRAHSRRVGASGAGAGRSAGARARRGVPDPGPAAAGAVHRGGDRAAGPDAVRRPGSGRRRRHGHRGIGTVGAALAFRLRQGRPSRARPVRPRSAGPVPGRATVRSASSGRPSRCGPTGPRPCGPGPIPTSRMPARSRRS